MGMKAEERKHLREQIGAMLKSGAVGLSQNEMAVKIGISATALSQWLKGKYPGSNTELETKIERWIETYNAGEEYADELPPEPEWVKTPTASRVYNAIEMAHRLKSLVCVYGAAGSGKTKTCLHYQTQRSNVWMFTPTKATSSVRGILTMMCSKMAIRNPGSGNYAMQEAIMRKMASSGGVVIIDEAQQLNFGALDLLRQIQEQAGIGMVWCGNEPLYTQMTGGARGPKFAQIFSRLAQRTHIETTREEDVDLVASAMGITEQASLAYLRQIGVLPGGLRGVVKTIQLASMAAVGSGKELNRDLIARAWRKLTNE
jgi:DNA transposition AAA+ family ATPase